MRRRLHSRLRRRWNRRRRFLICRRSQSWMVRNATLARWRVSSVKLRAMKSVFEFQRKKLLSLGFKELPNSSITDQAASAMFGKKGFVVSVSVFPQEPNKVLVSIQNHGNIQPGKLPVPPNVKPIYVG